MEVLTKLLKSYPLWIGMPEKGFPLLRYTDEAGGVIEKEVLPEALYQLIGDSLVEGEWQETPLLPSGCFRYARYGGKQKILLFVEGGSRDTWLFDQRIVGLPFPNLVFGFVLDGQVVTRKYVVAVKTSRLTMETELYKYPYSNVYDDARACWEGLPEIQEVFQAGTLPDLFFASPDNGHLYGNSQGYRVLIEDSKGKPFLGDSLVKRDETLSQLWARL